MLCRLVKIYRYTKYIQTTREVIEGVEYLYFSEEHSHATEQKLVKDDVDAVIDDIDRIVFAEDEVTTGKTILNIIDRIEQYYPGKVKFSVASLLNGMSKEHLAQYEERKINLHYLVKTSHEKYEKLAAEIEENGKYHIVLHARFLHDALCCGSPDTMPLSCPSIT